MNVTNYYCPKCGKATHSEDDHVCERREWLHIEIQKSGGAVIYYGDGLHLTCDFGTVKPDEVARLIAAASDLLGACEAARHADIWDVDYGTIHNMKAARASIADRWAHLIDGHINSSDQLAHLAKSLRDAAIAKATEVTDD